MLEINAQINSEMEDVLNFKCVSARDQNLEIRLTNIGKDVITVQSFCDLESEDGAERVDYLYPQGPQPIVPGDCIAFYCYMDENKWETFRRIAFYDDKGNKYEQTI